MALDLFFLTNRTEVAKIAECYGVNRIWVDLERLGKKERQQGRQTVISDHSISDIIAIRPILKTAKLMTRINPWNINSSREIEMVIDAGTDIIMLPMWKTPFEVEKFISSVRGRVKTVLLLETKEAVDCIDEIMTLGYDELHIGLNDLHISYGLTFMFELLANGTVEIICRKCHEHGIPYGFGGIASLGKGLLPSENVIMEHYRLGSTRAILSRSFCDINTCRDIETIEERFSINMERIRMYENYCSKCGAPNFEKNRLEVISKVEEIVREMKVEIHGRQ